MTPLREETLPKQFKEKELPIMNSLQTVFHHIFNNGISQEITSEREADLIIKAKGGNDEALVDLMFAYGPALRTAYYTYSSIDADERQGAIVAGMYEAIWSFDVNKGARLAATLPHSLQEALSTSAGHQNIFNVPKRTLSRFFNILRAAEGDSKKALTLCEGKGMSRMTYLLILQAVQTPELLEILTGLGDDERGNYLESHAISITTAEPINDEDDDLLEVAWASVEPVEEQVVRHAYGFESYGDPQTDDEVGEALGFGRMTANRTRHKALTKMRIAVGVDLAA